MIVQAWLERAAQGRPGVVALETPGAGCTYSELLEAASAGAAALAERGAAPGARVAIALPPGLAFAQALHACLLLGAVAVPVDTRLATPERELIAGGADVVVEEPLPVGARGTGARGVAGGGGARPVHDLNATALIVHTSGTTSAPRPVELT